MLRELLVGVILPAGVAAAVLALAFVVRRAAGGTSLRRAAGALAVPAAYLIGHVLIAGWPPWPAIEASQWLVYFAAAAIVVGAADSARLTPWWIRWPLRIAASFAAIWLLTDSMREYRWDSTESVIWSVGLTVTMILLWSTMAVGAARSSGLVVVTQLVIIMAATAVVLGLSGSAKLAQLGGVLTAGIAATAPFVRRVREGSPLAGAVPAIVVLWSSMLMIGYFYAELTVTSALLLTVAPFTAWIAMIPTTGRLPRRLPAAAVILSAALLSGAAVVDAYLAAPDTAPQSGDYGEYYEYDYDY